MSRISYIFGLIIILVTIIWFGYTNDHTYTPSVPTHSVTVQSNPHIRDGASLLIPTAEIYSETVSSLNVPPAYTHWFAHFAQRQHLTAEQQQQLRQLLFDVSNAQNVLRTINEEASVLVQTEETNSSENVEHVSKEVLLCSQEYDTKKQQEELAQDALLAQMDSEDWGMLRLLQQMPQVPLDNLLFNPSLPADIALTHGQRIRLTFALLQVEPTPEVLLQLLRTSLTPEQREFIAMHHNNAF